MAGREEKPVRPPAVDEPPSEREWDEVDRSFFASGVLDPNDWYRQADELMAAALVLRPVVEQHWARLEQADAPCEADLMNLARHGCHGQFMMLCAFAIENYCKGLLVGCLDQASRRRVRETGRLPKDLGHHRLLELMRTIESLVEERIAYYSEMMQQVPNNKAVAAEIAELNRRRSIVPDERTARFVKRLERYAVWAGRYPVPVDARDRIKGSLEGGRRVNISEHSSRDPEDVQALIDRLMEVCGTGSWAVTRWRERAGGSEEQAREDPSA